jgi:hypothetical protein
MYREGLAQRGPVRAIWEQCRKARRVTPASGTKALGPPPRPMGAFSFSTVPALLRSCTV